MNEEKPYHNKSITGFKLLYASGLTFFVFGFIAIIALIADVKGSFAGKSDNQSIEIADLNLNVPAKNFISSNKNRDGVVTEIALILNWSPDPSETGAMAGLFKGDRIAGSVLLRLSEGEIDPKDRLTLLWQRYLKSAPFKGPAGLEGHIFTPGSPYDGEVLFYDPKDARKFAVRCLQATDTDQPEICLREIRIAEGKIDLLVKFPRAWLNEWRDIDAGVIEELNKAIR